MTGDGGQHPAQSAFDQWVASFDGDPGSFRWVIAAAFQAGWEAHAAALSGLTVNSLRAKMRDVS